MTESFISYPVNDIQAYKYNILMTLQSAIANPVIADSRDISVYCGKGAYRPSDLYHDPVSCTFLYVSILKS